MKMNRPTIKVTLHTGKKLSNGLSPIMLRYTHNRRVNLISLGLKCKESEWNKTKSIFRRSFTGWENKNTTLKDNLYRADSIIDIVFAQNGKYDFNKFKGYFKDNKTVEEIRNGDGTDDSIVIDFYQSRINNLIELKRYKTAATDKCTLNSIKRFIDRSNNYNRGLRFSEIDYSFLLNYENFLSETNKSGGIGIKMRHLRALFNKAIDMEKASSSSYPFKKYKVSKFSLKDVEKKTFLNKAEMKLVLDANLDKYGNDRLFVDCFIFSYFQHGINFIDIARLKRKDIDTEYFLTFNRSKTKGSFAMQLKPRCIEIVNYYKKKYLDNEYVFPIFNENHQTPKSRHNRREKINRRCNSVLKMFFKDIGVKKDSVTFYVARNSASNILLQEGVPLEKISQMLGHVSINTTKRYVKCFSNEEIDRVTDLLLV